MDSYQDRKLIVRPFNKNMTDEELDQYLAARTNYNEIIPALIEANRRKDKQIADLSRRLTTLEEKTLKKPGRKRQSFYCSFYGDKELTDDDLCRLIDEGYFDSIGKMEKELGASKNQLRNRINKARKNRKIGREVQRHGNR